MTRFQKREFPKPSFLKSLNSKKVGYTSDTCSKEDLNPDIDILRLEGCKIIYRDSLHQKDNKKHNQLIQALEELVPGDQLIVTKIDRLGESSEQIINFIHQIQKNQINLRSLDGLVNTKAIASFDASITGLLLALSEAEKSIQAKLYKKHGPSYSKPSKGLSGRPKTNEAKEGLVVRLREEGYSYRSIRDQTGLALSTIRRIIVDNSKRISKLDISRESK